MKRDDTPKVFDVSRPSRSNPDNTSRPIIVGHRPEMVDPMVHRPSRPTANAEISAPPAVSSTAPTHHGMLTTPNENSLDTASIPEHHQAKVISVSEDMKNHLTATDPTPTQPQPETPPPAEPSAPEPSPAPAPEEVSATIAPTEPTASPEASSPDMPASSTSSIAPQANDAVTSSPQQPATAEVHHQSLPLGHAPITSTKRLKHMVLWLFVIVFLAVFLGYLAIDSGFISSSINLPFHIFGGQA